MADFDNVEIPAPAQEDCLLVQILKQVAADLDRDIFQLTHDIKTSPPARKDDLREQLTVLRGAKKVVAKNLRRFAAPARRSGREAPSLTFGAILHANATRH